MSTLSFNQLFKDYLILRDEYQQENKQQYRELFSNYFGPIDKYIVYSKPFFLSWSIHPIYLELNCYQQPIRTFFFSAFDMEAYSEQLRANPMIRKMTKLCFYIEENIEPYSPDIVYKQ